MTAATNYYFFDEQVQSYGSEAAPVPAGDRARQFGLNQYMQRAQDRTIMGGDYCIQTWLYIDAHGTGDPTWGHGLIANLMDDEAGQYWMSCGPTGQMIWAYWDAAGDNPNGLHFTQNVFLPQIWHHAIFQRRADGTRWMHFNGSIPAPVTETATGIGYGDTQFNLGRFRSTGDTYLRGRMDEVVIWPRILEHYEILNLYNQGAGMLRGHPSFPAGAINHWPLSANEPGGEGQDVLAGFDLTNFGTTDANGIRVASEPRSGFMAAAL